MFITLIVRTAYSGVNESICDVFSLGMPFIIFLGTFTFDLTLDFNFCKSSTAR